MRLTELKGGFFFEVQCSNLSLVYVIVQHLPQLISIKLLPSLTPSINKEISVLIINQATTTQAHSFSSVSILLSRHLLFRAVKRIAAIYL